MGDGVAKDSKSQLALIKGLLLLAAIGLAVYLVRSSGMTHVLNPEWVDEQVRGKGAIGVLVYIGLVAVLTGVGVPRQLTSFFGGYAFGFFFGVLWGTIGTALGCVLTFSVARILGSAVVMERFGPRVRRVHAFLTSNPFAAAVTIRFFPVGNNFITNVAAGVCSIPAIPFVLGSMVGFLPQNMVFALFGSGVKVAHYTEIGLSLVLFILSGALGIYLYRRWRRKGDEI